MNITSKAVFFNDETIADGIVMFTGTGTAYTEEGVTLITPVIGLEADSLVYPSVDAQGNYVINVKNSSGEFLIELAEVENQPDWTNDRVGALKAVQQIERWKKKSSVGTTNPKVYRALLSQSGTDAPTAIEMPNNSLTGITYNYSSTGNYAVISNEKFTENKTLLFIGVADPDFSDTYPATISFCRITSTQLTIKTGENDSTPKDGVLKSTSIEILVYD